MRNAVYHVAPVAEHWEVEDTGGQMIAEAATKEEAIEAAREAAGQKIDIVIHTADGAVEREITQPSHRH
jgi:hypothetical protein